MLQLCPCICATSWIDNWRYIDGLVQEISNSIANALQLRLSCTNPSICFLFNCSRENGPCHYGRPSNAFMVITLSRYKTTREVITHITSSTEWASYQIRKIEGCVCAWNAENVSTATAGSRTGHASRHVRDARVVMHAGIANQWFPFKSVAGKTYLVRGPLDHPWVTKGNI